MSYDFIDQHKTEWPVSRMCDALDVSKAGYYFWCDRSSSEQEKQRDLLTVQIEVIHAEVKARYGSPRMHAELLDRGHDCCVNTVARIMREAGIAAKTKRKFRHTTDSNHSHPVAENLLDRQFDPAAPNEKWVADMTYIATREGWLYLIAANATWALNAAEWLLRLPAMCPPFLGPGIA